MMTRTSSTWAIHSLCAILVLGGMGWLSSHVISMEVDRAHSASEAELQGRVRLGLSRMDTAASGLLLIENQRPPYHFRAFYKPEDVFNTNFENLSKGSVVRPSPLASELPEFVNLHFEVSADGSVNSPQVPAVDDQIWGKIISPSPQVIHSATSNLQRLRELLTAAPQDSAQLGVGSNWELMCVTPKVLEAPEESSLGAKTKSKERSDWLADQRDNKGAQSLLNSQSYQAEFSRAEKGTRAAVYNDTLKKAVQESGATQRNRYRAQKAEAKDEAGASLGGAVADQASTFFANQATPSALEVAPIVPDETKISPFHALWVAGELFAIRSVETAGVKRFQGVWFNAETLRDYLVQTVKEDQLLPKASLEATGAIEINDAISLISMGSAATLQDDPLGLVTMPWRLVPGETIVPDSLGWTELRISLGFGWIAALFGLLVAAVLMRGVMKLSERRASFVSSVTHELRTPLTTFQLYSDMLAEGMVTDEEKKVSYLKTLRSEAGRLNHLIENVLAYSRIERGGGKTRTEPMTLHALIDRLRPRLEQRVQEVGASLSLKVAAGSEDQIVQTDAAAVEQVVFNLVDNACKYGLPEEGEGEFVVRVEGGKKTVRIEVCDNGQGIARRDRARLFKPFQKSSRDEADTKPGVGLGLSLCRRLARELGGDLVHSPQKGGGACFLLKLPKSHR